jgi:tellurite resistance protein
MGIMVALRVLGKTMNIDQGPAPLYIPLGYHPNKTGDYCFVIQRADGEQVVTRSATMLGMGWLLSLHPSISYWRNLFPAANRGRVDRHAAAAWFTAACLKAGPITPPKVASARLTAAALIAAADKRYQERKATARVAHHYRTKPRT